MVMVRASGGTGPGRSIDTELQATRHTAHRVAARVVGLGRSPARSLIQIQTSPDGLGRMALSSGPLPISSAPALDSTPIWSCSVGGQEIVKIPHGEESPDLAGPFPLVFAQGHRRHAACLARVLCLAFAGRLGPSRCCASIGSQPIPETRRCHQARSSRSASHDEGRDGLFRGFDESGSRTVRRRIHDNDACDPARKL